MLVTGLAFLIAWLLVAVFTLEFSKALLITAIIFLILGLVIGERPWTSWRRG